MIETQTGPNSERSKTPKNGKLSRNKVFVWKMILKKFNLLFFNQNKAFLKKGGFTEIPSI